MLLEIFIRLELEGVDTQSSLGPMVGSGQTNVELEQLYSARRLPPSNLFLQLTFHVCTRSQTFLFLEIGGGVSTAKLSLFLVSIYEQSNPILENHSHSFSGKGYFPVD